MLAEIKDMKHEKKTTNGSKHPPSAKKFIFTISDVTRIGMAVAVIEVCKAAFAFLPNIELTSFWLIVFTLFFGWKIMLVVPAFILIEGCVYGFGMWWFSYLCAWPLLVLFALRFRRQESLWFWCIFSGAFGLCFGLLCAIPYIIVGTAGGSLQNGLYMGFTWWVAGIPWDILHCAGNFLLMLTLYKPISIVMQKFTRTDT